MLLEIYNEYGPKIQAAKNANDENEAELLVAQESGDVASVLDPLRAEESQKLSDRARRLGLKTPSPDDWYRSGATGDWILTNDAERELRRAVDNERRIRNDEFRKWAAFIFGVLGFVLGFFALNIRQKQPDPCQRNYYRNDAGACVFALPSHQQPSSNLPTSKGEKPSKPSKK
jgi:hypothetical protein